MPKYRRASIILLSIAISFLLLVVVLGSSAQASESASTGESNTDTIGQDLEDMDRLLQVVDRWRLDKSQLNAAESESFAPNLLPSTTLTIANISSIWAPIDKQNPNTGPRVFVVEAEVTNVGSTVADTVSVTLDYNEDPSNGWIMVAGEDPLRTKSSLDPGDKYHAYWFVSYPGDEQLTHQYTVTVDAANALPVSTAENAFNTPGLSTTVETLDYQPTGNNGQVTASTNVIVGVAYTITIEYDIGNNAQELTFSPVGNIDFDPSATRLLSTTISFQNSQGTTETVIYDRLYFPLLPPLPDGTDPQKSVTTYKFLALKPVETSLCSYTAIRFEADKYDNQYCDPQSTIQITGSLSFSLTKTASRSIVLQDDYLTYTIEYTNNGPVDLQSAWIWDEIDPALATFVAHTNNPAPDPAASSDSRIAWFLDNVPAGSSGTLTITAQIEGDGKDLTNGTSIVNNAYFGINPGSLPSVKAMTSTVTSTLEAPDINIQKSDGLSIIGAGESLTYTINLINDGSVPAKGLVLTDVLPAGVSLVGNTFPAPDEVSNGVIKWYSSTLGTLEPNGGSLTITIPVSVTTNVSDGTTLTNSATLLFENDIGHLYQPSTDEDTTTVIKKKGFVEGIAYEDLDGDGILDGAEPGIPGVKVLLPAAISPMVTTDSNGYYRFQIYSEGPVSTTANLPSGYFRTTPGLVFFQNTFGVTKTVNFGFAKDSSDFGVVYGTVFEDGDQNGVQELGEGGLSGVNITSADAATTTVLSNEFGQYTLLFNAGISTTISETNPLGYVSTTPDIVALDVITGSDNSSPVDFGDFQGIKITGMVFEDSNVNGENDGESGLAGALVQANGKSMTTGSSGVYTLYLSTDGRPITVTEADPSGYVSTNAVPGSGMAKIDNNSLQISNPVSGTVYTGDFGDVNEAVVATIYGYVFEDANGNGIKDSGEPGIPGVDVWLDQTITDTTNADGLYSFATAVSATHTVTEEQPSGYFSTTPDEVHLAVKLGQIYRVDFGDAPDKAGFSAIYGTVFEDSNSDGQWDDTEIGLTNVTVTLSITKSLVTDLYGRYTFSTTIAGEHTVVETDPDYYFSTTPNTVTVDVELNNGYQVNYGDVRADMARCPADAFEEDDANNQAKDLSVGVVQKHDFCDDAVDWTKISVKTGRTYTITTSSWGQRADTHLALFDMDGQTLLIANDDYAGSVDHSSRLIWKATDTGEFFIRTTNRAALEGFHTEYNIWVDEEKVHFVYLPLLIKPPSPTAGLGQGVMFSMASIEANFFFPNSPDGPSGEINHAFCPDAYEIDDTWQQAKDIEVGIPQLHWFDSDPVIYAADKDFGAFDLQSGQEITFTVTSTTSTEVLLELYDDQGIYAGLWGIDSLKVNGLQAGKYFLSASPTSSVFKSCENKPSYELLAETKAQSAVYIPIIIK